MILSGKFQPLRLLGVEGSGPRWPNLVVTGQGLLLRPPQLDDFAAWSRVRAESRAFLEPWEPLWPKDDLTRAAFRRRVRRYDGEIRADEAYPFFIFQGADGALAGGLTLGNVRRGAAQTATLGYWMGRAHAGKGIMTTAARLACAFAFKSLALERIEAACLPENGSSMHVLEKAGFQREGFARSYLNIAGRRRDHVLFALLASDDAPATTDRD
jgi:ribosomal-protein-alanine N-acetyltransferase